MIQGLRPLVVPEACRLLQPFIRKAMGLQPSSLLLLLA